MSKVAVLGFGVVGSGVVELLTGTGESAGKKADDTLDLKYIIDIRDFENSPYSEYFVKDFSVVENDPEVSIVVETIGGASIAYEFTKRAMKAGKSVVTSNKEVVATHGYELMKLAEDCGVTYLFEASVGGGIPILRPLNQCMAANEIDEICGILNGTTNYISTKMIVEGISFEDALSQAQAKGYAESDPSADILGWDTCRKTCILASLAYGFHVLPSQVPTIGITKVSLEDIAWAKKEGYRIKLLGRVMKRPDGKYYAFAEPHLLPESNPLATVDDVFNAITLTGSATGEVMFYGKGAGKMPTASAVTADVIAIARQMDKSGYRPWAEPKLDAVVDVAELESKFYVRPEAGEAYLSEAMTRGALEETLAGTKVLSIIRVL